MKGAQLWAELAFSAFIGATCFGFGWGLGSIFPREAVIERIQCTQLCKQQDEELLSIVDGPENAGPGYAGGKRWCICTTWHIPIQAHGMIMQRSR